MPEKTKLLNVGFPKAGNTWIGRTLSCALNAEFIEFDNEGNIVPDTMNEDVLKLIKGNITGRGKNKIKIIEKTHLLPYQWKNRHKESNLITVYVGRDPRDVSVSFFYYQYHHRPYRVNGKIKECGYFEKKKFIFRTIYSYYVHAGLWKPYISCSITYEEQWNDTYNALETLLNRLEVNFDEKYLKEAIDYFSWNNLVKTRKQGETDNREFMRSGVIGSYKNEFDLLDHILFCAAYLLSRLFILKRIIFPGGYKGLDIECLHP